MNGGHYADGLRGGDGSHPDGDFLPDEQGCLFPFGYSELRLGHEAGVTCLLQQGISKRGNGQEPIGLTDIGNLRKTNTGLLLSQTLSNAVAAKQQAVFVELGPVDL